METRANYILIGAFTVLSLILAAIFTVWIANAGFSQQYTNYDILFQGPVRGVEVGGEVRFNGIKVGEVTDLSLEENNPKDVVARVKILSNTPIKIDSYAQLEPSGLTGMNYIQILAGGDNSPILKRQRGQDRAVIPSKRGPLDKFMQGGAGIVDKTMDTVDRINRLLSDENIDNFSKVVNDLQKTTDKLSNDTGVMKNANDAAVSIKEAGLEIKRLSRTANTAASTYDKLGDELIRQSQVLGNSSNRLVNHSDTVIKDSDIVLKKAGKLVDNLNTTSGSANSALDDIKLTSQALRDSSKNLAPAVKSTQTFFDQATYQTLPDLSAASQDVSHASQTLNRVVQEFDNSPGSLLSKAPDNTVKWKK